MTTSEQFQALAIRQRAGRARQANAASGFAAFSSDIAARVSGGDLDPAVGKSIERRRRALREQAAPFNAAFVRAVEEGVAQTPLLLPAAGQTQLPELVLQEWRCAWLFFGSQTWRWRRRNYCSSAAR